MNQKEHHKKVSFEDEYRQFLIENGIEIDERYFLKEWISTAFQAGDSCFWCP